MFEFPDELPSDESQFATFIPARNPEFKVHRTEGLANSAMGQRGFNESFAKYELRDGNWVKVFEYHPATKCSECSNPFVPDRHGYSRRYEPIGRNRKVPRWKSLPVCYTCHLTQLEAARKEMEEKREREELARLQQKYN